MRAASLLPVLLCVACAQAGVRAPDDGVPAFAPERPGVVDTYFIGFAGSAAQPVFRNEVQLARDLAARRLDAGERWRLHVVESLRPADARPATRAELWRSLDEAARVMNVEEDVLVLWLSSHGRRDAHLQVRDEKTELEDDMPAAELAAALDARGFRWRVVVVSACFGGTFIPPLAQDGTIVLTAADALHPSFGCKPDRDLSFFGKAVLDLEWRNEPGLLGAFDRGVAHIEEWEREGGHAHSHPSASIGPAMAERLAAVEGRGGAG